MLCTVGVACSSAGVKPVDKRDGSGAHNWGTMMDDLE